MLFRGKCKWTALIVQLLNVFVLMVFMDIFSKQTQDLYSENTYILYIFFMWNNGPKAKWMENVQLLAFRLRVFTVRFIVAVASLYHRLLCVLSSLHHWEGTKQAW